MGKRYYDPTAERFLNRDPAWPEGGLNSYNYCSNRPLNMIDPDGSLAQIGAPSTGDSPPVAVKPMKIGTSGNAIPDFIIGPSPIQIGINIGKGSVIACGIEAGHEICTYSPSNNPNPGPFTCLGNAIWHHCIEPFWPTPSYPPVPIPVPMPTKGNCGLKQPIPSPGEGPGRDYLCFLVGEVHDNEVKHCTYECPPDGRQITIEVPTSIDCDAFMFSP